MAKITRGDFSPIHKHNDCPFEWCESWSSGRDHLRSWVTRATSHPFRKAAQDEILVSLDYDEDNDSAPRVLVGINADNGTDMDAGLTIEQATDLLLNLAAAIRHGIATETAILLGGVR